MAEPLEVIVTSTDQKLGYTGQLRSLAPITIDYVPPLGSGQGYLPLELLLMSLAACSGGTIGLLLRKMGKNVSDIKVTAQGIRREQHPTSFQKIHLKFHLISKDTTDPDIQKAIQLAEASICPVWAMLKNDVEIATEYTITNR
jgi:putative redox protein